MKIIAIIPARAGSKGVPNKNIRLLNGKPLIYYSINNALNCKLIDQVIVSTDSQEVAIIAKQMGASVHWRNETLCGDDITLDSVIFDAIQDNYDPENIIITLQPTSPTLKVETLKKAIEHFKKNSLDTLISAINSPHLAWILDKNGNKKPAYENRLNRQQLPPHYKETGAFLISKQNVISEHSRIGKKVDIFCLTEEESIDIDTFADLKICEEFLQPQKVAFYVNGNTKRGLGHIYRCLELADEFYIKPDIYYDINQTPLSLFGKSTHNFIGVDGIGELFNIITKEKYDLFINDILNTTIDYMLALKKCNPAKKIINFEDDGEGAIYADLIINALYEYPTVPQMKVGEQFYISPKTFLFYNKIDIRNDIKNIFISFGGADPQNYTDRMIEIIKKEKYSKYNFIIVIGRAKENIAQLLNENKTKNLKVYFDIKNMPEIMHQCDIAITSRGRTGYELAMLGIPTIAMAQNAREEKHRFINHENGFNYIGLNPNNRVIESNLDTYLSLTHSERLEIQSQLLKYNLRNGRSRVFNLINSL